MKEREKPLGWEGTFDDVFAGERVRARLVEAMPLRDTESEMAEDHGDKGVTNYYAVLEPAELRGMMFSVTDSDVNGRGVLRDKYGDYRTTYGKELEP